MKEVSPQGEHNKLNSTERIKNYIPFAEDVFEQYCKSKDMKFRQLHLNDNADFGESPIPMWTSMSPFLKSFPDYFVYNDKKQMLVEVKSSPKVKVKDLMHYCAVHTLYAEGQSTDYYIAFCFKDGVVKFYTVEELLNLIQIADYGKYHDGKEYYDFGSITRTSR
jgi:hypothetical protein|tara:strand:- start:3004 stop:3495 length:492 start_codon:yes stop_codon:yes gene_type:complete